MTEADIYTIKTFDEAIEYVADFIGSDFRKSIDRAMLIADDPNHFTGPVAAVEARRLAAYRVSIGIAAQEWKLKSANSKRPQDRLVKDALMCLYDSLLELINCLKVGVRMERDIINNS